MAALLVACGQEATRQPPPASPQPTPPPVPAQPTVTARETYELSAKCGQEARVWFKDLYGNGVSRDQYGETRSDYSNHYNAKSNRCYAVVGSTTFLKATAKGPAKMAEQKALFDVNENKNLGSYLRFHDQAKPMQCEMGERYCSSAAEWDEFSAPFMNQ